MKEMQLCCKEIGSNYLKGEMRHRSAHVHRSKGAPGLHEARTSQRQANLCFLDTGGKEGMGAKEITLGGMALT